MKKDIQSKINLQENAYPNRKRSKEAMLSISKPYLLQMKKPEYDKVHNMIEEIHRLHMTATGKDEQQICDETECADVYKKLPKKTSPAPDGIPHEAGKHDIHCCPKLNLRSPIASNIT